MPLDFGAWARAIQALAGMVLALYVAFAMGSFVRRGDVDRARRLVVEGAIAALGLMLPATILRTLVARDGEHILGLALVLATRILIKRLFVWEKSRIHAA